MDIKLYKLEVMEGKEHIANEWLEFLKVNRDYGSKLLKNEKAYFEAYFSAIEGGVMYVYLFFAAKDVNFSNQTAMKSENELDKKHFEYIRNCIDLTAGDIMDCLLYFDNTEDIGKY